MVLGDNIFYGNGFGYALRNAVENSEFRKRATIFGYYVNDPERFGVVEFDNTGRQSLSKRNHVYRKVIML